MLTMVLPVVIIVALFGKIEYKNNQK